MIFTWNITIPDLTGGLPRLAYLYLPDSFQEDDRKRYPVLYMFDGHNLFFDSHATYGKSWGLSEYLERTGTELIIAAVECDHDPNGGRFREYAPFTFYSHELGPVQGNGPLTMNWLIQTFKPFIDSHYPTLPDRAHTFIGGSAMGGLMSLFAVLEYGHTFSRAAALSPAIWYAPHRLEQMIQHAPVQRDTLVYLDCGSRELNEHPNLVQEFLEINRLLVLRGVWTDCRIVPKGSHCEASWERQIPFFMNSLKYEL